jgi:hypothetical protein
MQVRARGVTGMERVICSEAGTGCRVEKTKVGVFIEETCATKADRQGASVEGTAGAWEDVISLTEDRRRLWSLSEER